MILTPHPEHFAALGSFVLISYTAKIYIKHFISTQSFDALCESFYTLVRQKISQNNRETAQENFETVDEILEALQFEVSQLYVENHRIQSVLAQLYSENCRLKDILDKRNIEDELSMIIVDSDVNTSIQNFFIDFIGKEKNNKESEGSA